MFQLGEVKRVWSCSQETPRRKFAERQSHLGARGPRHAPGQFNQTLWSETPASAVLKAQHVRRRRHQQEGGLGGPSVYRLIKTINNCKPPSSGKLWSTMTKQPKACRAQNLTMVTRTRTGSVSSASPHARVLTTRRVGARRPGALLSFSVQPCATTSRSASGSQVTPDHSQPLSATARGPTPGSQIATLSHPCQDMLSVLPALPLGPRSEL